MHVLGLSRPHANTNWTSWTLFDGRRATVLALAWQQSPPPLIVPAACLRRSVATASRPDRATGIASTLSFRSLTRSNADSCPSRLDCYADARNDASNVVLATPDRALPTTTHKKI